MRASTPLLSLALCCSLASAPAQAANGHEVHRERARSHDEPGARDDGRAEHARAEAERAHARAEAERAHARARARAAHRHAVRAAHRHPVHVVHTPPPGPRVVTHRDPARPVAPFVDRTGDFSLGLTGGSYFSGYESGASYGDFGLGLVGRYRLAQPVGLEVAWSHYRDAAGERATSPLALSVQGFGFPNSPVNPYALLGVTFTGRSIDDTFCEGTDLTTLTVDDTLFGPHAGLGLEIALGKSAALDLEGRVTSYLDVAPEDPTVPAAIQARVGFNWYF